MRKPQFQTEDGRELPAVTEGEMREIDRIAVDDFGLGILQMMENAGRNVAELAVEMVGDTSNPIAVLAGSGGNGGGGLCCARHLHNRGFKVHLLLSKPANSLRGAAKIQLNILLHAGLLPISHADAAQVIQDAALVIDALIGYSLQDAPTGETAALIQLCNRHASRVLSLDVPSGVDATSGETPGVAVKPERTLTLALPKTGLAKIGGNLFVADIGIPPEVYAQMGITFEPFFKDRYWRLLIAIDQHEDRNLAASAPLKQP